MQTKKAFTLIELLAVIIILAIIALIATPIILDVVEDARISAGKSEANMILGGINNYCASEDMKYQLDNNYERICISNMNEETISKMVNLGSASIDKVIYDGEKLTELVITSNNHKFTLCPSGTFVMDDEKCDGEEVVQGDSLIETLFGQYQDGQQTGLVKDESNENLYYYKGTNTEVTNNFLWYGGHQWRILEFDISSETLTLISQQPLTAIQLANSVWTTEEEYESSYIDSWLNDYFLNSLDSSIQNNILDTTFNIGTSTNISQITTIKKVGLLDQSQYEKAGGLDSFLDIKDNWWLGNSASSYEFNQVYMDGNVYSDSTTSKYGIRPVIKIKDINIIGGSGTLTSNYKTSYKSTSTSDIQVGEYINVPISEYYVCTHGYKCIFRVVSKDNDSIKVVLNGLLGNSTAYGNSAIFSKDLTIYNKLTEFANKISTDYRYAGEKTFYIGDYPFDSDYNAVKDETLLSNVGLPTVGEMFSGNDIDAIAGEKTFVDENTLEGKSYYNAFWMMNRFNPDFVYTIDSGGGMNGEDPNYTNNVVRPVIYLNLDLEFTDGDGTAQKPYELQ